MPKQLTYREAAKRIGRTTRAIRYMRQDGMPMGWDIRNGQRVRVVEEKVLLKHWRQRLKNWPPHQYRLRRALQQEAAQADKEPAPTPNHPPRPPGRDVNAQSATRRVS